MESSLGPLLPLFQRERTAGRPMVLAVLAETLGSTYRKPGALLLIDSRGEYAGLLSGGCLEGDLAERAREVIRSGRAQRVTYDLRNPDDLVWGLGLGCEGAMCILLLRVGPEEQWQPLDQLAAALEAQQPVTLGLVLDSHDPRWPVGAMVLPGSAGELALRPSPGPGGASLPATASEALARAGRLREPLTVETGNPPLRLFALPFAPPPRVLLLGGGPDAAPLVAWASRLHWRVSVVDHRPAYAQAAHFPEAHSVVLCRPEALPGTLALEGFRAAVVMSHHLPTDLQYLRVLAASPIGYVGLLGPRARRDALLASLGEAAASLQGRLRAPVGLDLGGRGPEAIALAIVAELHQYLSS